MVIIRLPKCEGSLLRALQELFNTTFSITLENMAIEFQMHQQSSVVIEWPNTNRIEFDVFVNHEVWLKAIQSVDDTRKYQLHYVAGVVDDELFASPSRSEIVYIKTDRIEGKQLSEQWIDALGKTKCLFARSDLCELIEPVYHFAWVLLLFAYQFSFDDVIVVARAAMNVSRGTWPDNIQYFPSTNQSCDITANHFLPINLDKFTLYPVVDSYNLIQTLVQYHNVYTVQLRLKNQDSDILHKQIRQMKRLMAQTGSQLFINDYWELAIKYKMYGVHLGQEDLGSADLNLIRSAGVRLGVSTHGYYDILIAESISPSYIALGHIFPTTTKDMSRVPMGTIRLALLQRVINSMKEKGNAIPTVAIGGITLSNAGDVLESGVNSIAVVSAITQAADLEQVVAGFNNLYQ